MNKPLDILIEDSPEDVQSSSPEIKTDDIIRMLHAMPKPARKLRSNGQAIVKVPHDKFNSSLSMPSGIEIVGSSLHEFDNYVAVKISGDRLPHTPRGSVLPIMDLGELYLRYGKPGDNS